MGMLWLNSFLLRSYFILADDLESAVLLDSTHPASLTWCLYWLSHSTVCCPHFIQCAPIYFANLTDPAMWSMLHPAFYSQHLLEDSQHLWRVIWLEKIFGVPLPLASGITLTCFSCIIHSFCNLTYCCSGSSQQALGRMGTLVRQAVLHLQEMSSYLCLLIYWCPIIQVCAGTSPLLNVGACDCFVWRRRAASCLRPDTLVTKTNTASRCFWWH